MKKIFFIFLALFFFSYIYAQEIKVLGSYSHTNYYDKYENSFGYGFGYNFYVKSKNKLGFVLYHSFSAAKYEYAFFSDAYGIEYYRKVETMNQRITLSFNYAINIYKGAKSNFYLGPKIGFNFFRIDEDRKETISQDPSYYEEYNSTYWDMGKPGVGFLVEYERNISDNFSLSLSSHPELVFYSKFGLKGSNGPVLIPWLNFNISVQYRLND